MEDRPNSLLTNAQREYLRDEKDYSPSTERKTRERIRDRTAAGVADLKLLSETLESDDWDQIFDEFSQYIKFQERLSQQSDDSGPLYGGRMDGDVHERGRMMTRALHGAAEFLYIALREHGGGIDAVENVLETAISDVETTRSQRAEVDVNISIEHKPRPEELLERAIDGEQLTREELSTLLESGETDVVSSLLLDKEFSNLGSDEE